MSSNTIKIKQWRYLTFDSDHKFKINIIEN